MYKRDGCKTALVVVSIRGWLLVNYARKLWTWRQRDVQCLVFTRRLRSSTAMAKAERPALSALHGKSRPSQRPKASSEE